MLSKSNPKLATYLLYCNFPLRPHDALSALPLCSLLFRHAHWFQCPWMSLRSVTMSAMKDGLQHQSQHRAHISKTARDLSSPRFALARDIRADTTCRTHQRTRPSISRPYQALVHWAWRIRHRRAFMHELEFSVISVPQSACINPHMSSRWHLFPSTVCSEGVWTRISTSVKLRCSTAESGRLSRYRENPTMLRWTP
eukprot:767658-Hanusia_phi.AAC.5